MRVFLDRVRKAAICVSDDADPTTRIGALVGLKRNTADGDVVCRGNSVNIGDHLNNCGFHLASALATNATDWLNSVEDAVERRNLRKSTSLFLGKSRR